MKKKIKLSQLRKLPVGRLLDEARNIVVEAQALQRNAEQVALDAIRPALKLMVATSRRDWNYPYKDWRQLSCGGYYYAFQRLVVIHEIDFRSADAVEGTLEFQPDCMLIVVPGHQWRLPLQDPGLTEVLTRLTQLVMKPSDAKCGVVKSSELTSWSPRQVFLARGYSIVKTPGGDLIR